MMKRNKIVVVKKPTLLEELLWRHATTSQAKFYLEASGQSFDWYESAHNAYHEGFRETLNSLPQEIRSQVIERNDLDTFQFSDDDLVVAVGDPGLLVNVAKYVGDQPIISVNPDKKRFDDILSSCDVNTFPRVLGNTLENKTEIEPLTMAEARLDDGQVIYALNDLFIGRKTHVSSRYSIEYQGESEKHSSSGIIVCTGTGSTGWMTSVITGAAKISQNGSTNKDVPFPRDSDYLVFSVREPFPTKVTGTSLVYGHVTKDNPLVLVSNMPEEGVIFSDGIEKDCLVFTSGRTATIRPSDKKVQLIREGRR